MMNSQLVLLILLAVITMLRTRFSGQLNINEILNNQVKIFINDIVQNIKICHIPEYHMHMNMLRQASTIQMLLKWIVIVTKIIGCLYALSLYSRTDFRIKYYGKINIRHSVLNWIPGHNVDVLCLEDYLRDRLTNNLSTEELMKYEWARYESFKTYPDSAPHFPLNLARAGFYYSGEGGYVKCFCCGCRLNTWQENETVMETHRRISPDCRFARGDNNTNVPIYTYHPPRTSTEQSSGERNYTKIKRPEYASEESRKRSFLSWQKCYPAITQTLSEAGFYYAGMADCVRCFSCGGGLKNWSSEDDPWIEHARWFPQCQHVKQCKGEYYIRIVRMAAEQAERMADQNSHQETNPTDEIITRDLQSSAAQYIIQRGYSVVRVKLAIEHFRANHGNKELSAIGLYEYFHDSEPNLVHTNSQDVLPVVTANLAINNSGQGQQATEASNLTNPSAEVARNQQNGEHEQLREENRVLKHQMTCKICLDKEACIVFLPCGHMVSCVECAQALRKCAVCRSILQGTVRAYPA